MNRELYIGNGIEQSGPYSEAEIRAFVQSGHVTAQALCWKEGMSSWVPLQQMFPAFFPPSQALSPPSVPPQQLSPRPVAGTEPPAAPQPDTLPPPGKRSCCCSGCLILILLVLLAIGGLVGYAWFKYRQPPSPVERDIRPSRIIFLPQRILTYFIRVSEE